MELDFWSSKFCKYFDIEFDITDSESKILGNNFDFLEVRIHKEFIRKFYDRVKWISYEQNNLNSLEFW